MSRPRLFEHLVLQCQLLPPFLPNVNMLQRAQRNSEEFSYADFEIAGYPCSYLPGYLGSRVPGIRVPALVVTIEGGTTTDDWGYYLRAEQE